MAKAVIVFRDSVLSEFPCWSC